MCRKQIGTIDIFLKLCAKLFYHIYSKITVDGNSQTINYNSTAGDVDPIASAHLAMSVGFKLRSRQDNIEHYAFDGSSFDHVEYFNGGLAGFREQRAETLRQCIRYHSEMLMIISTELDMKLSDCDAIQNISHDLRDIQTRLDNLIVNAYEDRKIIMKI